MVGLGFGVVCIEMFRGEDMIVKLDEIKVEVDCIMIFLGEVEELEVIEFSLCLEVV